MATQSGFSSGWKGFVDHKWSKKQAHLEDEDSDSYVAY
jgi:hypothetical protein